MLSKLPPLVWTNPNLKWLDPANGIGNFPVVVYYKLMKTLKSVPEKERSRHIIEKMLYMNELTNLNVRICRRIFKMMDPNATPNLLETNFLTEFMVGEKRKKCWFYDEGKPIDKFDIILGNPPYNPPKTTTGSSGNVIWPNFVMKSFYLLHDTRADFKPLLLFIHPPGWKKPTPNVFNEDNFKHNDFSAEIRQGQVWQHLKEKGVFSFIYTNDQLTKTSLEFIKHFPAVDFYVYQKGNHDSVSCDTKNIFLGNLIQSVDVKLNYSLKYLPNLITKETQFILHKLTTKEGEKPNFRRGIDERGIVWNGKKIDWVYNANKTGFQMKQHGISAVSMNGKKKEDTVNIDKIILNFGGGFSSYTVEYISKDREIGVLDKTMYSEVNIAENGHNIENFFNSDIVRFIFLITQYASGAITQNEPIVANSITIPPKEIHDYYSFFGIEKYKSYIENILRYYEAFKQPKKKDVTQSSKPKSKKITKKEKSKKGGKRYTRKI
jgi:hypothetical protein